MRLVIQRVTGASVVVDANETGRIGAGFLVLVGIARGEDRAAAAVPERCGRFDRSLLDVGGAALVVWQFTLIAGTSRGRRPYFGDAADPAEAAPLVRACGRRTALAGGRGGGGRVRCEHARRAGQRRRRDGGAGVSAERFGDDEGAYLLTARHYMPSMYVYLAYFGAGCDDCSGPVEGPFFFG